MGKTARASGVKQGRFHMLEKAMIIIAVSRYPDMRDLPGTLVSAKELKSWAEKPGPFQSYDVLMITDEDGSPVLFDDVQKQVVDFMNKRTIDRLVVYFAGHGISTTLSNQYWLLTNAGTDSQEVIHVDAFRRGLANARIGSTNQDLTAGQLIFIGDACRTGEWPDREWSSNAIYTQHHGEQYPLHLDGYYSSRAGRVSLHIDGTDNQAPYCLFSRMIVDALSGKVPHLGDDDGDGNWRLTNFDFADYLDRELPIRSKKFSGQPFEADTSTGIRPKENIYAGYPVPPSGRAFASKSVNYFQSHALFNPVGSRSLRLPTIDPPGPFPKGDILDLLQRSALSPDDALQPGTQVLIDTPSHALWHSGRGYPTASRDGNVRSFQFKQDAGAPVLARVGKHIQLVPQYPNTIAGIHHRYPGDIFLHLPAVGAVGELDTCLSDSFNREHGIQLRFRDAPIAANQLHVGKNPLPHLSVVAAYLYESAGDKDTVTRTAHYMARGGFMSPYKRGLPTSGASNGMLPFDLALLCAERIDWRQDEWGFTRAYADLPEIGVRADDWNTRASQNQLLYAHLPFEELRNVPLWGACPMFRPGWDFLAQAHHLDVPRPLRDIAANVEGSTATRLTEHGLDLFVTYFRFQKMDDPEENNPLGEGHH